MDVFEQAAQTAQIEKTAAIRAEQEKLEPTLKGLKKGLAEFQKYAAKVRPALDRTRSRAIQFHAATGVFPQELNRLAEEAEKIMTGAPESFKDGIRQIENLSAWDVYQKIHVGIPGKLATTIGNKKRLEFLMKQMEQEERRLTELLPGAGPVAVTQTEQTTRLKVETSFDPMT